jgi:hypothetical protein
MTIRVTLSKWTSSGRSYTSDIDPLIIDNLSNLDNAIKEYCTEWASYTQSYNTDEEDYILEFYADTNNPVSVWLSEYAEHFNKNL